MGKVTPERAPALLVSYYYLKNFLVHQKDYVYRDWVLDSGAFTAHAQGEVIDVQEYIDVCKALRETDPTLTAVFGLDVISDWRASQRNYETMWKAGVQAIPTYHVGEPTGVLTDLAASCDKIALGGMVPLRGQTKVRFAEQCFARVWPKKIHGFGVGQRKLILALPWHSVDATNWESGPSCFGQWKAFGGHVPFRGSHHDLRVEVDWYLKLEHEARQKWAKQMVELDLRLACGIGHTFRERKALRKCEP